MSLSVNRGKKLEIVVNKISFNRYPIKTPLVTPNHKLTSLIKKHVKPHLQNGDVIVISERIVAIIQGRSYLIDDIHPSFWARHLYKFVSKHPGGIGLRSPWTMELAIREAGLIRIFLAAIVSLITRPLRIRGLFYIIAGHNVNAIDGPCDYSLPPSDKSAKLGPKNPQKVVRQLANLFKTGFVIIDANDYGVRVMAVSSGIDKKLIAQIIVDNPMGQSREQTPIIIVRRMNN